MSKPTIVFIPGAWLPEPTYSSFLQALEKAGYPVRYISFPSSESAGADCQQDATAIRDQAIKPLIEHEGKDILLLMHSYGSMPGASAARGFCKTDRQRNGQAGGIIALICIGAFLVPEGLSCAGLQGGKLPDWVLLDQPEKGVNIPDNAVEIFAADVEPGLTNQMTAQLKPHSNLAFTSEQPPSAWTESSYDGRCAYIVTGEDRAVSKHAQYQMIEGTGKRWIVKEIPSSSHMAPFLSLTDICIELVHEIVSECEDF
ncbi:conserved hypothetical protein [Talaromyces stipitatus ATCC 10500]|uniref:AB hydrolase-1 domain-containing protein n=1 Tax=Talaromyces stipitatus (strain ATCC 10500 / CBS 375.48 / QM 6759 / NRRL 1006) TaxID=441959 RepID=B8MQM2_TALSN|nr:uncharacterized protein TSTA_059310 [Talaromyces stipitatus ATCC 10500]EED13445.1 conserved hypothetical protein [Talaromyces stipitatus ATCC 10500]